MPGPPGVFLIICSIDDEVLNSALEELQLQQQQQQQQQQQRRSHSSEMLQQESRRREKPTFKELASHQIFTQDSNMHSRSKRNFFRHVKKMVKSSFFIRTIYGTPARNFYFFPRPLTTRPSAATSSVPCGSGSPSPWVTTERYTTLLPSGSTRSSCSHSRHSSRYPSSWRRQ